MKLFTKNIADKYCRKSYSQMGEDCIIDFVCKHIQIENPSYIDIGAHHPFFLSNTAYFYERGCRGINIEPDPTLFAKFPLYRPHDNNLNIGIAGKEDYMDFYILSQPELNTFSKEEALRYQKNNNHSIKQVIKIKVDTISNVLNRYFEGKFPTILSLDVEGIDEIVLRSIQFDQQAPVVICVETIGFSSDGVGFKNNSIIEFLIEKGYFVFADTSINTIFVKQDRWR